MNVGGRTNAQNVLAATEQMPIRDGKLGAQCGKVGIMFGLALEQILHVSHNVLTLTWSRGVFTSARRQAPHQGMDQLLFHAMGRLRIDNRLRPYTRRRGWPRYEAA